MNEFEKQVAAENKQALKNRALLVAKLRDALKSPSAKELIWQVLLMANVYQSTFTGNSQGAFLEGRRAVGLDLLALLEEVDSTFYPRLLLERQKDRL